MAFSTPLLIVRTLLPAVVTVFAGFLVVGLAMPVLPLFVHQGLGMGMVVVGVVAGAQFVASFLSRFHRADVAGAKRAVIVGLMLAVLAGVFYAVAVAVHHAAPFAAALLFLGRGVLGAGESFMVAGALVWGLRLVGDANAGMVMAWVGTPMYLAYALGAPRSGIFPTGSAAEPSRSPASSSKPSGKLWSGGGRASR